MVSRTRSFEHNIGVESNPTEQVISIQVLFIPTKGLLEKIRSLFQKFYKEPRTASWPARKEFNVDGSVSRAKSCAFNISNCSVVFKV